MQIFVKNQKTFTYVVEYSDTIESLKEKIFDREAIPNEFYYLSFGGKILEPTRVFSDYLITEGSTILLNYRLAGGRRKRRSKKTQKLKSFSFK
jgi:hypothetical protein